MKNISACLILLIFAISGCMQSGHKNPYRSLPMEYGSFETDLGSDGIIELVTTFAKDANGLPQFAFHRQKHVSKKIQSEYSCLIYDQKGQLTALLVDRDGDDIFDRILLYGKKEKIVIGFDINKKGEIEKTPDRELDIYKEYSGA